MSDFSAAEKKEGRKTPRNQDVKRLINNFLNQIKLHFDLKEEDINVLLESLIKNRKAKYHQKKWWQVWK